MRKEMEEAERMTTTRERRAPRRGSGWEDLTIVIVWLRRTNGTDVLSLSFLHIAVRLPRLVRVAVTLGRVRCRRGASLSIAQTAKKARRR